MNEMNHDDGLSSAARSALATLRAEDDLPADARARMWARLAAAPAPEVEVKPARRGWTTGVVVGLALAASVALALVSLGRGAQEVAAVPRADAAIYGNGSARPQPVRAARPPVATPGVATVIAEPEPQASPVAAPMRERREPVDRKQPVPSDTSTLAAETALLQRAQTALAAGDPAGALARLDEHRESFADGVLARERDALQVTALCDAGRGEDSRAAAAMFVRRHPTSMLTERVQGTCVTP